MIGGLKGLKGLDPKRRREPREPKPEYLGCAGVCLETSAVPSSGFVVIREIEFWTGPGYTGAKLTGTPYATSSWNGSAESVFDGALSSWWQASVSGAPVRIGIQTAPNPILYANNTDGAPFAGSAPPKSFRVNAPDGETSWCSAYRVYVMGAWYLGGQVTFGWELVGEFSGIAFPGGSAWWGTDL